MNRPEFNGEGESCAYCKRELVGRTDRHPTRDHVVPKSKGGKETVWCCTLCNNLKGDMMPEVWAAFMLANPRWWEKRGYVGFVLNGTRHSAQRPRFLNWPSGSLRARQNSILAWLEDLGHAVDWS